MLLLFSMGAACAESPPACPALEGVAVQVLGSGGPIADDDRASTGYIVWVDGQSRVLIDAGGGTFLRFGEAGANFAQLDLVGLSHFHTDHSADFPWRFSDQLTGQWRWQRLGSISGLRRGDHQLFLKLREELTLVDKFLMTSDASFVPEGLGDPAENSCSDPAPGDDAECVLPPGSSAPDPG